MAMGWEEKDDTALLEKIQEGYHPAFAMLVRRHTSKYYALAYRTLRTREEAEDAVQECFLKLWEKPDMWRSEKNVKFTTWFYRVVLNSCLDRQRRKPMVPLADDAIIPDTRILQDEALVDNEQQLILEKEISALPERQRTALNLCIYEELPHQEAADAMQVSLKVLQSLLMRAKTRLKERIAATTGISRQEKHYA